MHFHPEIQRAPVDLAATGKKSPVENSEIFLQRAGH
jgi:hypothetical protein